MCTSNIVQSCQRTPRFRVQLDSVPSGVGVLGLSSGSFANAKCRRDSPSVTAAETQHAQPQLYCLNALPEKCSTNADERLTRCMWQVPSRCVGIPCPMRIEHPRALQKLCEPVRELALSCAHRPQWWDFTPWRRGCAIVCLSRPIRKQTAQARF